MYKMKILSILLLELRKAKHAQTCRNVNSNFERDSLKFKHPGNLRGRKPGLNPSRSCKASH